MTRDKTIGVKARKDSYWDDPAKANKSYNAVRAEKSKLKWTRNFERSKKVYGMTGSTDIRYLIMGMHYLSVMTGNGQTALDNLIERTYIAGAPGIEKKEIDATQETAFITHVRTEIIVLLNYTAQAVIRELHHTLTEDSTVGASSAGPSIWSQEDFDAFGNMLARHNFTSFAIDFVKAFGINQYVKYTEGYSHGKVKVPPSYFYIWGGMSDQTFAEMKALLATMRQYDVNFKSHAEKFHVTFSKGKPNMIPPEQVPIDSPKMNALFNHLPVSIVEDDSATECVLDAGDAEDGGDGGFYGAEADAWTGRTFWFPGDMPDDIIHGLAAFLVLVANYHDTTSRYAMLAWHANTGAEMDFNFWVAAEDDTVCAFGTFNGGESTGENIIDIMLNFWSVIRGNGSDCCLAMVGAEVTANEYLKGYDLAASIAIHGPAWAPLQRNPNLHRGKSLARDEIYENASNALIYLMFGE